MPFLPNRPFCRKKFLKTDGCNKMTCSCGAFVCYICRKEILKDVGFKHFCQTPHCNHKSCNLCALYTNSEEDDKIAVKEAGMSAARSVSEQSKKQVKGGRANGNQKGQIRVDIESLLKEPPASWGRKR